MKAIRCLGFILLMTSSALAGGKGGKMSKDWNLLDSYKTLQIIKYKSLSDRATAKEVVIGSEGDIKKLVALIRKVPANGDIMVKPGPDTPLTRLVFTRPNGYDRDSVDIMNERIKTPSTGFNSEKGASEKEALKLVWSLLEKTGVWFAREKFDSLQIVKRESLGDRKSVAEIKTDDADFISSLVRRISSVPADGDKMKSLAESAAHTSLTFSSGKDVQVIDLYEGKLKTPSTGFNANPNEDELKIGTDVEALLAPEIWKPTPKVKNLELKMKGLSVVFKGTVVQPQDPKGPTIGPISTDTFEIRDSKGTLQTLKATSGQTPYAPVDFKINGERHVLDVKADFFVIQPFRGE